MDNEEEEVEKPALWRATKATIANCLGIKAPDKNVGDNDEAIAQHSHTDCF